MILYIKGYIYTFEAAKQHCDKFIVFLHRDPSEHRKSKYKHVIPIHERYRTLMAIRYIDEVYVYQTEEELKGLIKFFKPDIRILGEDYIGKSFTGDDLPPKVVYTTRALRLVNNKNERYDCYANNQTKS